MKIIIKDGETRAENIQLIIVDKADKYGVAMLAYFKNSLGGQNTARLAVKDGNQVQLYYNWIDNTYTLQILRFKIATKCIINNYRNFKAKYDILIKDKLSQI